MNEHSESPEKHEENKTDLKDKGTGIVVAAAKAGIVMGGMVAGGPLAAFGAGLAAEMISIVVPQYKQERYEKWVNEIERRVQVLEGVERERAEEREHSPEFADLFENATRQAIHALSEERRQQLATLLVNSLCEDEVNYLRRKRLLEIFGQVNDAELLLLQSSVLSNQESLEFWKQHPQLRPPLAHISATQSGIHYWKRNSVSVPSDHSKASQEDVDKSIVFESFQHHLADLGLLKPRYKKPARGEAVELDFSTGQIKSSGYETTDLGRLLLHEVGLHEPMRRRHRQNT